MMAQIDRGKQIVEWWRRKRGTFALLEAEIQAVAMIERLDGLAADGDVTEMVIAARAAQRAANERVEELLAEMREGK